MKRNKPTIPKFKTIEEESDFWDTHSPLDFEHRTVTMAEVIRASRVKSKKQAVTLQLEEQDIRKLKKAAAKRGVSYQTLAADLLHKELAETAR